MKRRPVRDTLYSIGFATLGASMVAAGVQHAGNPTVATGLFVGGLASCAYATMPMLSGGGRSATGRFEHLKELTPFKLKKISTGGETYYQARFKERPAREFVFSDPRLLSSPVPESVLADVVRAGKRREMNARYGSRVNMMHTTSDNYRRLKIHEAWSEVWFTKIRRNRILPETFSDCITILTITGYIDPPRPGRSARLLDPRPSAGQIVEGVREWWIWLHRPRRESRKVLGFNLGFAN